MPHMRQNEEFQTLTFLSICYYRSGWRLEELVHHGTEWNVRYSVEQRNQKGHNVSLHVHVVWGTGGVMETSIIQIVLHAPVKQLVLLIINVAVSTCILVCNLRVSRYYLLNQTTNNVTKNWKYHTL